MTEETKKTNKIAQASKTAAKKAAKWSIKHPIKLGLSAVALMGLCSFRGCIHETPEQRAAKDKEMVETVQKEVRKQVPKEGVVQKAVEKTATLGANHGNAVRGWIIDKIKGNKKN